MRLAHAELTKRGVPLASNQVEYSLLNRTPEVNGVLNTCRELGGRCPSRAQRTSSRPRAGTLSLTLTSDEIAAIGEATLGWRK